MRSTVRFLLGRQPRELHHPDPTETVLEWLRLREHRTGTKEGCAEGDCGACTVVVGRAEDGRMRYEAINACIRFVPTLDGCQLLTVEDLRAADGGLHPVQRAIVDQHGTQCGFCTPGFVMSMWVLWQRRLEPTREVIDDLLAGNLCRCTGYGPLAAAAFELRPENFAADAILARESQTLAQLEGWARDENLDFEHAGRQFSAPTSVSELAATLLDHPNAVVLGGATDVGLWVTKQDRRLETIVSVGKVTDLSRIDDVGDQIEIGASATYAAATAAIAELYPDAGDLIRRLGSVQIRNAGTVGGNVANGSPIGDMPPFLIAAGASLVLRRGDERRSMPLESFFLAYGKQDRRPGEFVERILLPKPQSNALFRCWKISKRFDQDISAVCGAFNITLDGNRVVTARIAYGGMAATPKRAVKAEVSLTDRPWNEATVAEAMQALGEDFAPIGDMRASAAYRLQVAKNLLRKCWLDSSGERVRLAPARSPAFV